MLHGCQSVLACCFAKLPRLMPQRTSFKSSFTCGLHPCFTLPQNVHLRSHHLLVSQPPAPLTPSCPSRPSTFPLLKGRPEQEGQQRPAWGYGDSFDESALPPNIRKLAERIKALPGLKLGPLRDVTVNYRHHQFYR